MNKLTKKERFQESVLSRFHVYNSIFATLPYDSISDTGNLLPIFTEHCKLGYSKKQNPKLKEGDRIVLIYMPDEDIDTVMKGNICRCGTYVRIKEAIKIASTL